MKILITNFHPTGGGGHVSYVEALLKIGNKANFIIAVATPERSNLFLFLKEKNYPYLYACDFPSKIQKELPSIVRSIQAFKRIIQDFKPDIVHANGSPDLSIALWSFPFNVPFKLIRTHHAIRHISDNFYYRAIYKKQVAANVFVSGSAMELSAQKGFKLPNCHVIENGVDLTKFAPILKELSFAAQYGIDENSFCFGSCAGTGNYKRIDTIIDAAIQIKAKTNKKFYIVILGGEEAGKGLEKQARSKGFNDFIYCGFHQDVRPFISILDVGFILSDAVETISFAAREMMAMGKPLLSSSFAGLKENVVHGENGFLVKPGDVNAIAAVMLQYLEMSPEQLRNFAENARDFAVKTFDIQSQIERHAALYQRVLGVNKKA